jgi:hypothetical protein
VHLGKCVVFPGSAQSCVCVYIYIVVYVLRPKRLCGYEVCEMGKSQVDAPIHVNIIMIINIILHRCAQIDSDKKRWGAKSTEKV